MDDANKRFYRKDGGAHPGRPTSGTRKGADRRSGEERRVFHCFIMDDRRGKDRRHGERRLNSLNQVA